MIYMGAIANGGKAAEPYLILRTESAWVCPSLPHFTTRTGTLISADTAAALADLMANNVTQTYGASRFPNMDLCAKSGTAEVGGGQAPHAWFTGFLRDEDHPYAFLVLVENGGSGSSAAGDVASGCSTLWCPPDLPRPAEALPCRADFLPPSRCICYADMVQLTYVTAAV